MLNLIERCFGEQARSAEWSSKLKEIFPAREKALQDDAELYRQISRQSDARLGLIDAQAPEATASAG